MARRPRTRTLLLALALAALGVVAACGDDSSTTTPKGASTQGAHNAQDVAFTSEMIPHHQQAVEMADLVLGRDASAELKALAQQVKAAQGPEIQQMAGWLQAWGEQLPGEHGVGHGMAMSDGMLTEAEFSDLDAAQGTAFARQFLEGMIRHHQGAVAMAREEIAQGQDAKVKALAQAVVSGQTAEITLMQRMLADLH
jgi:uncharacterized protein (DUF305 family)